MTLFLRIAAFVTIAIVASVELGGFALAVWANCRYEADGPWVVAQYAEPFRSVLLIGCVLGMSFSVFCAFVGHGGRLRRAATAIFAVASSAALCLELGMGVLYHPLAGEISVAELFWERDKLKFPHAGDGVCVDAALDGFYTWHLNGARLHPRLLPLPLDAQALKAELTKPSPSECPARLEPARN